jgi:hypothetical protein
MKCLPKQILKIEAFIIIGVGGSNIDSQWIFFEEEFFEIIMYILGCVLWNGDDHYVTYICKWFVYCTFVILLFDQVMKYQLGWIDQVKALFGHVVHGKLLLGR